MDKSNLAAKILQIFYTVFLFSGHDWRSGKTFLYLQNEIRDSKTDLVTVFDAILTIRQTCKKLQCLYENLMSNNFRKTAILKKILIVN